MSVTDDILFEKNGRAGVVTLNKPQTLNAVTDGMLTALNRQLDVWEKDDAVKCIIIKAVPGRAFSAGGDIRHLYERGKAGDYDFDFFAREYKLNARIAKFPKPYIALVDGIAMGGGVGVSFHGSHRIAGDNITFAMPEVGIGFFPDIGASYFLSRLPEGLGLYLGLTGARVKQADAIWCGLATHGCTSDQMGRLENEIATGEDLESVLETYAVDLKSGPLEAQYPVIRQHFEKDSLDDIFSSLAASCDQGDEWARKTLDTLRQKSPLSLAIAFRQIHEGRGQTIDQCMKMEFRILKRILVGSEFYEGIRAAIIDKDNAPVWNPAQLENVDMDAVNSHFEVLGEDELEIV